MSDLTRLKSVAVVIAGQSPPAEDVTEAAGGLPFIQGNAEFGELHPTPVWECDNAPKIAGSGDLILSVRAPVGALNVANRRLGIGRGVAAVRAIDARYQRWLYWALEASREDLLSRATGSTFGAVSASDIGDLRFRYPTNPRQIADYLDHETAEIDAFIAEQLHFVELLKERSDAVLRQQFAGRANEVISVPIGRLLKKLERPAASGAGIVTAFRDGQVVGRWARRADGFTEATSHVGYQGVTVGDLVFHGLDGFAGAVGVSRDNGICSPVYHVCQANADVDLEYLALLLRSLGRSGFLEAYAWSVRQRAVDYRNWQTFGHLRVSVPERRTQTEGVRAYRTHESGVQLAMADANAAIVLAKERRAAIINAAVTGQIDVKAKLTPVVDSIQSAIEEAR